MLPGTMLEAGAQGANVRSGAGTQYPILLKAKPGAAAPATGKERPVGTKTWYEIEAEGKKGWVSSGVVKVRPPRDDVDKARIALKAIVTNDKVLYQRGLEILQKIVALEKRGVDVEAQKRELARIAAQFFARQRKIQEKVPGAALKTEVTDGMKAMQAFAESHGLKGIGFIPLPIIIGIVVTAIGYGVGSALGFFKEEYGNGVKNLKESETLKKALDSLTPAEAAAVREDLENQIDKGYSQGVKDEKDKGFWGKVKTYALVGGIALFGILVIPRIIPFAAAATAKK